MQLIKHMRSLAALLLAASLPTAGLAADCYQQSPNLVAMGDAYYIIDDIPPLNPAQKAIVKAMVRRLKKEWRGTSSTVFCKGSERSPRRVYSHAEIHAKVSSGTNGQLIFSLSSKDLEHKTSHIRKERLPGYDRMLNPKLADSGNVSFAHRYRVTTRNGGSLLREEIYRLQVSEQSLNMTVSTYINGFFSSEEQRRMQED